MKELLDDYDRLFTLTGDVQAGLAKQGIAQIRGELQKFIETEVKNTTGADIRALNNNVSTAKELSQLFTCNCYVCKRMPCECTFDFIINFKS